MVYLTPGTAIPRETDFSLHAGDCGELLNEFKSFF